MERVLMSKKTIDDLCDTVFRNTRSEPVGLKLYQGLPVHVSEIVPDGEIWLADIIGGPIGPLVRSVKIIKGIFQR